MVRNPATVQACDTMENCLLLGRELGVAQFPVLDGEALVGVISANEIFQLAAHCLSNWQQGRVAPTAPRLAAGDYARAARSDNAVAVQSLRPVTHALTPADGRESETELVLRFGTPQHGGGAAGPGDRRFSGGPGGGTAAAPHGLTCHPRSLP